MITADVVVVGAGPAGLTAAAAAGGAGLTVVVLDENPGPGGQYLRPRRADSERAVGSAATVSEQRRELLTEVATGRVQLISGATVWAVCDEHTLAVEVEGHLERVRWQRLVLATGAYERTLPFPGWTLPGVMTAGAGQTLVKTGVLPGRRVLVAGSGPFLFPVAHELAAAGAQVVAVLQAVRPVDLHPVVWQALGQWDRLRETVHVLRALAAFGVSVRFGRAVVGARGQDRVEAAQVAAVDRNWRPLPGSAEEVPCDAICTGFGFVPAIELPRLLGCALQYQALRGGWVPRCDADGLTSVSGVYVAGEVGGIGGVQAALAEGRLAGLAAAASLGALSPAAAIGQARPFRAAARRARAFTDAAMRAFAVRPGLLDSLDDSTPICRCEGTSAGQVRGAIAPWACDHQSMKTTVRSGMGMCQGRTCFPTVADLMARIMGCRPEAVGLPSLRPPVKPVLMSVLGELAAQVPAAEEGIQH